MNVYQFFFNLAHRDITQPLKAPFYITPPQTNIRPFIPSPAIRDLRITNDNDLSIQQRILKRQHLYDTMVVKHDIISNNGTLIVSDVPGKVKSKTDRMIANKTRYEQIAHVFPNQGLKWSTIALLHEMEAEQDFNKYLGNGQDWSKSTTIVPKGRGPFLSFKDGAIDALHYDGIDQIQDWSKGNLLYVLEGFNGRGYALYKGINSPYLWSGSNCYSAGKYIKDGVYDKDAVSSQIGIALMLKQLENEGEI